jgi:hypothetical protein
LPRKEEDLGMIGGEKERERGVGFREKEEKISSLKPRERKNMRK